MNPQHVYPNNPQTHHQLKHQHLCCRHVFVVVVVAAVVVVVVVVVVVTFCYCLCQRVLSFALCYFFLGDMALYLA